MLFLDRKFVILGMKRSFLSGWSILVLCLVWPLAVCADGIVSGERKAQIVLGKKEAPVTVYMYSALTCGHCAEFHKKAFKKIKKYFIDSGKVRMIMRPFPIDGASLQAAKVVYSYPLQSTRYRIQDALYKKQNLWAFSDEVDLPSRIALAADLTLAEVKTAMANQKVEKRILQTVMHAEKKLKIAASPTFIIGLKVFDYAITYKEFKNAVKPLLPEDLKP